ncbi:MAG: MotA/TolQ/ExbB proton channel family protein [Bdellovibrionota bacterium]
MLTHLLPIIAVGAFTLAIIIERSYALYWKFSIDNHTFLGEVKQKILGNDMAGAIQICSSQGHALAPKVVKAGLLRASRDNRQIQAAIEIVTHESIGNVKKRVAYLAMFANIATLFGLLGTIMGLIKAFGAVANVDAATKSVMLADGISTSMNATATGLSVAIPAMIAFSVLQAKANRLSENLESAAMITLDLLGARAYRDEWDDLGNHKDKPAVPVMSSDTKPAKAS